MLRRGVGRSGPGVMGSMARAAVDADTATEISRAQRTANAESMRREGLDAESARWEEQAERHSRPPARTPAATAPVAAPSVAAAEQVVTVLRDLAALRDQGVLTADEFEAQKARLLG
jgi:Short C-terminal domain